MDSNLQLGLTLPSHTVKTLVNKLLKKFRDTRNYQEMNWSGEVWRFFRITTADRHIIVHEIYNNYEVVDEIAVSVGKWCGFYMSAVGWVEEEASVSSRMVS